MNNKVTESKAPETKQEETSFFHPLTSLRRDIDQLFGDYGRGWGSFFNRPLSVGKFSLSPSTDITETKESYEISVELPGLEDKDVVLSLKDNVLTLKGEKKEEREEKKTDYHLTERSYGSFMRSFTLPPNVDADGIHADFYNGVMTIVLPKTEVHEPEKRTIEIKSR
ncbi:Hsp20/alpha crystallin family protein [Emcibacter sp.]|uniref:Hsp20/alpha crystallin family protein n=1 Tax=Emcibacter sp. TaxID=1979954 RepID=UPI002AA94846|nr:Hsp20/alpha crystallin family protein [Emcibacter sp.]